MTVDIDVSQLVPAVRAAGLRSYPAQVWALATVVNRYPQFRMALDENGAPGIWDAVDPSFTVFNPDLETFCNVWASYEDFPAFHDRAAHLIDEHRSATTPFPQGFPPPPNLFDVSSIPWTSFTSVSLHMQTGWDHFAPAFTLGRYREDGDTLMMPLALQIHHAAADGYHLARLVNDLRALISTPEEWLT